MTDYSKWKIKQTELEEKQDEYSEVAQWCNDNGQYHIEAVGKYYQVAENSSPSIEEMQASVRDIRNSYLSGCDFTQLPDAPFTSEEKSLYARYRQYLRDYTNGENWWLENPKTFDDWKS